MKYFSRLRPSSEDPIQDGTLTVKQCMHRLFWQGSSNALSFVFSNGSNVLGSMFIGMTGDVDLQAAHGIGYSLGNMLVLTFGLGFVAGMDTFCPIILGAGLRQHCWTYLFLALTVVAALIPVVAPICTFSGALTRLMTPNEVVADAAKQYLAANWPSLFFMSFFEAGRKFLIYHQVMTAHTIISFFTVPLQALLMWIFIFKLNMGVVGAALSRDLGWFIVCVALFLYIWIKREKFGWTLYMRGPVDLACVDKGFSELPVLSESTPPVKSLSKMSNDPIALQPTQDPEGHEDEAKHQDSRVEAQAINPVAPMVSHELSTSLETPQDAHKLTNVPSAHEMYTIANQPILISNTSRSSSLFGPALNTVFDLRHLPEGTHEVRQLSFKAVSQSHSIATSLTQIDPGVKKKMKTLFKDYNHWWQGIPIYLRVSTPSTLLSVFEWIGFEMQVIGASYLSDPELAALSVTMTLGALVFFFHLSLAVVTSSQVGRAMGSRRPKDALLFALTALGGVVISGCIFMVLYISCRVPLSHLFSATTEIQDFLQQYFVIQGVVTIVDASHAALGGIIKSHNLQSIGMIFDFISLLGIMTAVGFLLAFLTPLRGLGFFYGCLAGLFVCNVLYSLLVFYYNDWDKRSQYLTGKSSPA